MSAQSIAHRDDFIFSKDDAYYWHPFGLERNPFPMTPGHNAYYPFHQWEEYLDLLQQLSRNNNVLLAVTGPKGSGKSTIMHQFLVQTVHDFDSSEVATYSKLAPGEFWVLLEETLRTCQVRADITLDPERLIDLMTEGFDLPWQSTDTLHEQIDAQIDNLRRSKQTCLLLIDDAHLLPPETLQALLYMINQQSESEMRFHALLFGDNTLKTQLTKCADKQKMEDITCLLELKPLTREETECYLLHCFKEAGLKGTMPLSHPQIQRIYKQSKGIPGQINQVAQQLLLSSVRRKPHVSVMEWVQEHAPLVLGSGLFVLTAVCLAMFMNNNSFDDSSTVPSSSSYQQQADTSLTRLTSSTAPAAPTLPISAPQTINIQKMPNATAVATAATPIAVTASTIHSEPTIKPANPINSVNPINSNNTMNPPINSIAHPAPTLPATVPNAVPLSVSIKNAEQAVLQSNRHPLIVAASSAYSGNTVALKATPHPKVVVAAAVSPVVSSVIEMKTITPEQPVHTDAYLVSQPMKLPQTFAQPKTVEQPVKPAAVIQTVNTQTIIKQTPVLLPPVQPHQHSVAVTPIVQQSFAATPPQPNSVALTAVKPTPPLIPLQRPAAIVLNQPALVTMPSQRTTLAIPTVKQTPVFVPVQHSSVVQPVQQKPIVPAQQIKAPSVPVVSNVHISTPVHVTAPASVTKAIVPVVATITTAPAIVDNNTAIISTMRHARSLTHKTAPVPVKVVATRPVAHVPSVSHTKAERQHLATNPQTYTLQLVGVSHEAAVIKLMKEQSLGAKASYFHTFRDGKDWYVLTYGNYATPQQALAAKASLPPAIQTLKPWVRKMASVHKAIKVAGN